jgi:DNA polymerase-3 subunit alpha
MITQFVHLKTHSEYSLVDSIIDIEVLVKRAASLKMPAVAVTDRVNLFGYVKFYKKALEYGVKPIIGADLILKEEKEFFLITVLCKNTAGYANLRDLISRAYQLGQVNNIPTISRDWLTQCSHGLIVLSGGRHGDIAKALLVDDAALATSRLMWWKTHFPNHFYIELQRKQRENEERYLQSVLPLAEKLSVPVVATNDLRFMDQADFDAHEARVCIQSSRVLQDPKRPKNYSDQQYFKTAEEMIALFSDIPEAIQNTVEIAKRCTVELTLGKAFLPQFPLPNNVSLK